MTEIKGPLTNHWISERFDMDVDNNNLGYHFYEDDDEKIRIVTDRWNEEVVIVGYSDPITLTQPMYDGTKELIGWILGIRVRDHALMGWHPNSIDQAEYPPYVSKPFQHPDYEALNKADDEKRRQRKRENSKKDKLFKQTNNRKKEK